MASLTGLGRSDEEGLRTIDADHGASEEDGKNVDEIVFLDAEVEVKEIEELLLHEVDLVAVEDLAIHRPMLVLGR